MFNKKKIQITKSNIIDKREMVSIRTIKKNFLSEIVKHDFFFYHPESSFFFPLLKAQDTEVRRSSNGV